jgi:hypothetical protein
MIFYRFIFQVVPDSDLSTVKTKMKEREKIKIKFSIKEFLAF